MKDKIKFMDALRWWTVKEKFKCVRCGIEHEDKRAIKRGKDLVCLACVKEQGLFAVTGTIREVA